MEFMVDSKGTLEDGVTAVPTPMRLVQAQMTLDVDQAEMDLDRVPIGADH
jgi:hypothetical protein